MSEIKPSTPTEEQAQPPEAKPATPPCKHVWEVGDPAGSESVGKCSKCDEKRTFRNSVEYSVWTLRTKTGKRRGVKKKSQIFDELGEDR